MAVYDRDQEKDFNDGMADLDLGAEQSAFDQEGSDPDAPFGQNDPETVSPDDYDAFRQEARRFRDQIDSGQGISMNLPGSDERAQLYRDRSKANKKNNKDSRAKGFLKKKAALALTGSGLSGLGGLILAIIMSISPLKFEFLFNAVDASAFVRYNVLFDRRSSKFIDAYIKARLFEIDSGNPTQGNMLFRASRVDNNNPFFDWYRTMRASSFENNLAEKHGIRFVAATDKNPDGSIVGFRGAKVTFKDNRLDFNLEALLREADLDVDQLDNQLRSGNYNFINSLTEGQRNQLFDIEIYSNDSSARKAIATAINQEIPFYRFLRRATVRRNIQNMIGVRDWRFFEKTRDRIDNRKLRFQNKLLEKTFALTNSNGKFFTCLFGGSCVRTTDPTHPDMRANGTGSADGTGDKSLEDDPDNPDDDAATDAVNDRLNNQEERSNSSNAARDALRETQEALLQVSDSDGVATQQIKKFLTSKLLSRLGVVTAVFNMVDFMDSMVSIHNNINSGAIQKMLVASRLASYISVYTAFATLKDQINSGEVIGEDAAAAFESLNGIEASEAYGLIASKKALSESEKEAACQPGQEEIRAKALAGEYSEDITREDVGIEPICPEDTIGSNDSSGSKLLEGYNNTIGKVIQPLAASYGAVRDIPIVSQVADAVAWASGKLGDLTSYLTDQVLAGLGLDDDLEGAMEWIGEKLAEFFGLGPVIDGSYGPATANAILAGGVGLAESSIRLAGGALPTESSKAYMDGLVAEYKKEQMENMSIWDKYFATSNHNSLVTRLAISIPTSLDGVKDSFTNQPRFIANSIASPVYAEEQLPEVADVVGQQTYDMSVSRLESDPLARRNPEQCTNAKSILGNDFEVTWGMVEDPTRFWDAVHSVASDKFGDDYDEKVGKIENVCLADKMVSDSMKTQYTSEDDGGLGNNSGGGQSGGTPTNTDIIVGDTSNLQCEVGTDAGVQDGYKGGQRYRIRICNVQGVQVNAQIARNVDLLITEARGAGHELARGSGGFRTMDGQIQARRNNGCPDIYNSPSSACNPPTARPGYSNHQMGLAIDFQCNGSSFGGTGCFTWMQNNAARFGLINLPSEPWHWSVDGN